MNVKKRTNAYGTHAIARICEVTPPTVGRWIAEGKLPAFTTGGGHHRVRTGDLVPFLKAHSMSIPPELKVDEPLRVLIVDDDPAIVKLVRRIIVKYMPNAEIHDAKDGFEAGHKVTSLLPSLVILDLSLPGVDGIKVCEMIKQTEILKHVKVLVITGHDTDKSRNETLNAGADGFLGKPFESKKLVEEIQKLFPANPMSHIGRMS